MKNEKHVPSYKHGGYLSNLIEMDKLEETLKKAALILRHYKFDAIAFRGMSGALIAPALALKLDKTLLMVRKPKVQGDPNGAHSSEMVEGDVAARTYVIVD